MRTLPRLIFISWTWHLLATALGLAVLHPGRANDIQWVSLDMPTTAVGGTTLSITATVTNTGYNDWEGDHNLVMTDANGVPIAMTSIAWVASGETVTRQIDFYLPDDEASYTFSFQALEHNVEWFGPSLTRSVTVSGAPPYLGMQLSTTTFSAANPPNISTSDGVVFSPFYRLRAKVIDGTQWGWHMANEWNRNNYPVDSTAPAGNYAICALYWVRYQALWGDIIYPIGPERRVPISVQDTVSLSSYAFHSSQPPRISTGANLSGSPYRLFARLTNAQGVKWELTTGNNNNNTLLTNLPPAGQYQAALYWKQFDSSGVNVNETSPELLVSVTISSGPIVILSEAGGIHDEYGEDEEGNSTTNSSTNQHWFQAETAGSLRLYTTGINTSLEIYDPADNLIGQVYREELTVGVVPGQYRVAVSSGGSGDYQIFAELTAGMTAPAISSSANVVGAPGTPMTATSGYTVSAFGSWPMMFSAPPSHTLNGLPSGLSLNPTTGVITGTPVAGTFTTWITAVNAAGSGGKFVTFEFDGSTPIAHAAEQITASSFLASWSPVSGATGYRLDVATNPQFSNLVLGDFPVSYSANGQSYAAISHTVSNLQGNTTYYYRVRAITTSGIGVNSATIQVTTSGSASGPLVESLWLDIPVDRKVNGVWTKVYDGVLDEIIPGETARGLTYHVVDWWNTSGSVTFNDYDLPVNDWWSFRDVTFDANDDGLGEYSRPHFTTWWQSQISFVYSGQTYFRLEASFNPEPGRIYEIRYSTNDVINASTLGVVNGGGAVFSENTDRLTILLYNPFTALELDRGSLYLLRRTFAPAGVSVTLPVIGDVTLRKGPGGITGAITILGDVTIEASANSATISKPSVGSVTVANGQVSGNLNLGGGYVISGVSNGRITLSMPGGATVSTGPGGSTMTIPGGIGITVSSNGSIGMNVPLGSATALGTAVDQLGLLLGVGIAGGPAPVVKVVPQGTSPQSVIWESVSGVQLGNRQSGEYSVGMKENNAPDTTAVWITLTVAPGPTASLAVDANRDGLIAFDSSDVTSAAAPFRFWVNDDNDSGDMGGSDVSDWLVSNGNEFGGSSTGAVDGTRDLVDFFPVYLNLKPLLTAFPPSSTIKYKLKHAGNALNFVYTTLSRDRVQSYHQELLPTGFGDNFDQRPNNAATHRITAAGTELSTAYLNGIRDNNWGVLLVEGRFPTVAPLTVVLEKNGATLVEAKLDLRISRVEEMFRQVNLTTIQSEYNGGPITPLQVAPATRTNDPGAAWPDSLTNGKYYVFVHGYNVDGQKAQGWHSEIFKRLHVLGSRARFVGVTWHGAPGLDYHKAVYHAFHTGDALANALFFTNGTDVTVAAHSLGNMVVGQAIEKGWRPTRYYLINAAVPLEAYRVAGLPDSQVTAMTEHDWGTRPRDFYAANWHELFLSPDHRSELTWKNRMARSITDVEAHNFYSPGEDVVANPVTNTASVVVSFLRQGFDVSTGAWCAQEFVKGVTWTTSFAAAVMERGQAGWDADNYYAATPYANISNEQLKTRPFFQNFLETNLTNPNPSIASALAAIPRVQYDLLARAIPALSFAAAANHLPALDQFSLQRNFNMEAQGRAQNVWPTEGDSGGNVGDWLHSDFKNAALPYVYKMYDAMLSRGSLK